MSLRNRDYVNIKTWKETKEEINDSLDKWTYTIFLIVIGSIVVICLFKLIQPVLEFLYVILLVIFGAK